MPNRVWVISEKRYHNYPATRWVVEWRTENPDNRRADNDIDFDPLADTIGHYRSFGARGKG